MGSYFSVGALALASEGANAVGAVRFTLLERGLEIELLKVGSYRESFLPGALTEMVRFAVPYTAVRGLVRRGAVLYLALDPKVASPHHRFALTRFSDQPMDGLVGAHHRRMRARLAALLLPAPASTLALILAPEWLVAGLLGKASLAIVVALATWALCRAALSLRTHGGPVSDEFRDAFEQRLLERLGLRPAWLADEAPFDAPLTHRLLAEAEAAPRPMRREPPGWPAAPPLEASPPPPSARRRGAPVSIVRATEIVPAVIAPVPPAEPPPAPPLPLAPAPSAALRAATSPAAVRGAVLAIGAAAAGVVALASARAVLAPPASEVPPPAAGAPTEMPAAAAVASAASPTVPPPSSPPSALPRCACERSDSPLWESPPPLLSVLPIPTRRRDDGSLEDDISPKADDRGRMRYEFDLAIVNNGHEDLSDVKLVLTFARRDERGERVSATDRGLFWEGALGPARSVKWTVRAPGTELRIDADEKRTLADVPPARGDAFFGLLRARQPAVRLHAATMLAYVGDARAEGAARALDGLSSAQEPIRQMVVRAASPLRVCDVRSRDDELSVCVYNATDEVVARPTLVEPSPDGRRVQLAQDVPPHEGLRVTFAGFGPRPAELGVERGAPR